MQRHRRHRTRTSRSHVIEHCLEATGREGLVTLIALVLSPVSPVLTSTFATIHTTWKWGTASIRQVALYVRGVLFRYKRKSRRNHRSYVLTEALSGVCFYAGRRKSYLCEHMKVEMILECWTFWLGNCCSAEIAFMIAFIITRRNFENATTTRTHTYPDSWKCEENE